MKKFILLLIIPFFIFSQNNNISHMLHETLNSKERELIINANEKLPNNQDVNFYFKTAWKYVKEDGEGSYDAIACFYRTLAMVKDGGVYSDLGNSFRGGLKKYAAAEYYYSQALQMGWIKHFIFYNRAICRYELGNMDGCREDLSISIFLGWPKDHYNLKEKCQN